MTPWRSGPAPGWRQWLLAGLVGWLWSVPVGLALWLVAAGVGRISAEAALIPMAAALFLIFAPAFSWVGLAIAAPMALGAARQGRFGPASAALIGAVAGALAAWVLGGTSPLLLALFGAVTLLLIRATLTIAAR
jgi:hypothetical protein